MPIGNSMYERCKLSPNISQKLLISEQKREPISPFTKINKHNKQQESVSVKSDEQN